MAQQYTLEHSAAENERLSKQANLLYSGPRFLDRFLTSDRSSVLDVACGTGVQIAYAAERCRQGRVVGVDLEGDRIMANRATYRDHQNLTFEQADVYHLPFPDATFDLCFCRFLLTHLANPGGAIEEMRRVTKPGGWVVAHELFQDAFWMVPPRPTFKKFFELWKRKRADLQQDCSIGLKLHGMFCGARFAQVELEVLANKFVGTDPLIRVYLDNLKGIFRTLKVGSMARDISDADLERINKELDTCSPADLCLELTMVVGGRK